MRSAALRHALAAAAALAALSGCGTVVERVDPGVARDLSGAWNDTDSRLVSEQMARELRAWIEAYALVHRRAPTLTVGAVRDLTRERISVTALVAHIERELVASGRATLVASLEERSGVRLERRDQDYNAAEATRKPMGAELGADFLLTGTISAIVDRADFREIRYYQVDLALIDVADNSKVWTGQKRIKKAVRRPLLSDGAYLDPYGDPLPRREHRFASTTTLDGTGRASRIPRWECLQSFPPPSCL